MSSTPTVTAESFERYIGRGLSGQRYVLTRGLVFHRCAVEALGSDEAVAMAISSAVQGSIRSAFELAWAALRASDPSMTREQALAAVDDMGGPLHLIALLDQALDVFLLQGDATPGTAH